MKNNGRNKRGAPFGLGWYSTQAKGVPPWVPGAPIPREPRESKARVSLTDALRQSVVASGSALAKELLPIVLGEVEPRSKGSKLTKELGRVLTGKHKVKALSPGAKRLYDRIQEIMSG